jgi:glycosyltransferase involved in cell wall biosynthesis
MKTLSVSGKFLSQSTTGVQRYAAGIVAGWDNGLHDGWIDRSRFAIRILAPHTLLQPSIYEYIPVERCATDGRLWEQIELPWRARGTLLFSPYAAAPLFKIRHAVTIHDAASAASSDQFSWGFRIYCSVVFRALGATCNPIFTVSDFSRRELHRYFSIDSNKVKVVPPGCDHLLSTEADASILTRAGLKPGRFILGVSSQSKVKNFEGLAKAWAMLERHDVQLAIAGRSHDALFRSHGENIGHNVIRLGYVTDAQLRSLYENAALFAYPSFYEGFGIPPVEAMSCGCPVVVARQPALQEACGDAALYCDPADVTDIARQLRRVLDDPQLAERLRGLGHMRAAELTGAHSAKQLWSELVPFL